MRMSITFPIALTVALVTEVMSPTLAIAHDPVPTPHATATAATVWGDGTRSSDKSEANTASHTQDTSGGGGQATAQPVIDLDEQIRTCLRFNSVGSTDADHCEPTKTTNSLKRHAPSVSQLRAVAAQLKLPDATPRFGPHPSVNEWNMLAVGFPIWLWTDRPTTVSTTAHHDGLTFTLTATWTSTTFTMGDGHIKTCAATTIRPRTVKPATKPSPTCGYVYQTKSKIGHPYTVTADTHWRIDWSTNGYSGTFDHTYTGSRTLEIGELQSLING